MTQTADSASAATSDPPASLLIIGDVGGADAYHVGDEGMLEANLTRLRQLLPDARLIVLSADPEHTSRLYGTESLAQIGFPDRSAPARSADKRLEALLQGAAGGALPAGFELPERALAVIRAVQEADAVIVSGGGNLNSSWPEHLYERLALLELAHRFETPAIVVGQTFGPQLSDLQAERLTGALARCRLVGARERASRKLLAELGVPEDILELQLDDALFLARMEPPATSPPRLDRPYLALSLSGGTTRLDGLAEQLDRLAAATDLELVFVPHAGEPDRDREVGARLGRRLDRQTPFRLLELLPATVVARVTAGAAMVVSSRYHPLVFACASAVPALGLFSDRYTRTKLEGALEHAGLDSWALPLDLAVEGLLVPAVQELWDRRDEVSARLRELIPRWETEGERHWQRVARALGLTAAVGAPYPNGSEDRALERSQGLAPRGAWRDAATAWVRVRATLDENVESARRYAESLRETLAVRDREIVSMKEVLDRWEIEREAQREVEAERAAEAGRAAEQRHACERELASVREVLAARDAELASIQPLLEAREEELASIRSVLPAREEELTSLRSVLTAREEELTSLRSVLTAREEELASVHEALEAVRRDLARRERMLDRYRASLVGKLARRLGRDPELDES